MADTDTDLTALTDDALAALAKSVQAEQERRTILSTATTRLTNLVASYLAAGGSITELAITTTASAAGGGGGDASESSTMSTAS